MSLSQVSHFLALQNSEIAYDAKRGIKMPGEALFLTVPWWVQLAFHWGLSKAKSALTT